MAAILSSISPDRPSVAITTLLTVMVQHAGGDFVGVQDAWPECGLPRATVEWSCPRTDERGHLGCVEAYAAYAVVVYENL
jgi:hypothetical protein